ncbi:hypothetical protein LEM8419_01907 [Neolewinella maritima]|uniref:HTH araC/xylS-type domain-containing protein n=1 Tax=Neolewinella maritima TaxID=1383882 RepID=A0ABM9B118_9BACT|nr:helix-turn-helix domain-containing protein [Neolewinella maritima]CAH1000833.1 hypothetical protein LEM8419_01907 [Neolewinella maritima]
MKFADLVSTFGIFQGLLLGIILYAAHRPARPTALLGLFILTLGLRAIPYLLIRLPFGEEYPVVYYLPLYFWYLRVPLMYLYTLQLVGKLKWSRDRIHLLPGLLEFVLFSTAVVIELKTQGELFSVETTQGILGVYTILAIGPAVYYTYLTVQLLAKHNKFLLNYYSNLKDRQVLWIRNVLYWLLAQAMLYTLFRYGPLPVPDDWRILFGAATNVIAISYASYYGLKQLRPAREPIEQDSKDAPLVAAGEPSDYAEIFQRMNDYLLQQRAYLSPVLTIADLAQALHCSKRTLSRVLSSQSSKHFNRYINEFRVRAACQLLNDEGYDHYTMDAIAAEVGFNHKGTFYKAFKQDHELSPAAYRRRRTTGEVNG